MQAYEGLTAKKSIWSGERRLYKLEGRGWFSEDPSSVPGGVHYVDACIAGAYDYSGISTHYCDKLPEGSFQLYLKNGFAAVFMISNKEDVSEFLHKAGVEGIGQLKNMHVKMYLSGKEYSKNARVIGVDLPQ